MDNKINDFYSEITSRETLKDGLVCTTLAPATVDQLANLLSLAYRYHYKVIVRSK